MWSNKIIYLFLLILSSSVNCNEEPEYECELIGNETCYLKDIQTTWENPNFKPKTHRSYDIKIVEIKSGKIPLLTKSLCTGFMNAENVKLSHLSIEKIDDYISSALNSCNKLLTLDLSYNLLTKIHVDTFKGNYELKHLNLEGNPIKELSSDFFYNIKNLKELNLAGTLIPYLHFDDKIRALKSIEVIQLSHTPLLDLDLDRLLEHVPSLKTIHLRDTNILCSRMTEIRNNVNDKFILGTEVKENIKRNRNYEISFSGDFECVTKEQWNSEVMERNVGDLLIETKFNILLEWLKKSDVKVLTMDQNIQILNENVHQFYHDSAYVSSYISFIATTLCILLVIISITSICMCCKVRKYVEEERYRSYLRQQQNLVIDSKRPLYF